jgi:hypothetical protein
VDLAPPAWGAIAARHVGVDRYAVTQGEGRNPLPYRCYLTGVLVTDDHGRMRAELAVENVAIGATDTACRDADNDLVRSWRRNRHIDDVELTDPPK